MRRYAHVSVLPTATWAGLISTLQGRKTLVFASSPRTRWRNRGGHFCYSGGTSMPPPTPHPSPPPRQFRVMLVRPTGRPTGGADGHSSASVVGHSVISRHARLHSTSRAARLCLRRAGPREGQRSRPDGRQLTCLLDGAGATVAVLP